MKVMNCVIVNVCRFLLAATFLFSGFVKANDSLGTVLKISDYLAAWAFPTVPDLFLVMVAIALAFFEFTLGLYLFFGMRRRLVSRMTLVFMAFMTALTVYIYVANPVKDCGCFGDAVVLTNGQTLLKNIVLLGAAAVVALWCDRQVQLISRKFYWMLSTVLSMGVIVYALYCIYALPVIDFRPYKVGTDLRAMVRGTDGQRPVFENTVVYEKDGKTVELGLDDDEPDSSWTYVETRRRQVGGTDKGTASGFFIMEDETDITEDIMHTDGYMFLLVAPDMRTADESVMDRINDLYDYSQQEDMEFYCLTASDRQDQDRWVDYTGAEYMIYTSDADVLHTMIRSNPGLIMLRDGRIMGKWSSWNFPSADEIERLVKDR